MDNKQQKLESITLKSQPTDKKKEKQKRKKDIAIGTCIATLIALCPYYFYLYNSVPHNNVWDTVFFTYDSQDWQSAKLAMWVLTSKLVPLLLLILWILTCRHWWYHVLLIPIVMYIYQIVFFIKEDTGSIDEFQILHLLPVMLVVVPSIYLVRARIFNRINSVDQTMQELEDELTFRPKTIWGILKQYF